MIRFFPLLLMLPVVGLDGGPAIQPDDENAEDANVLRIYDLSTLQIGSFDSFDKYSNTGLVPYMTVDRSVGDSYEESDDSSGSEVVVDLISDLFGEEFEYEGRRISVSGDQRLAIRGPEALQARVKQLLEFFDASINAQAELTVDVLELPKGPVASPLGSSVLSISDAQAWIDRAKAEGSHSSFRMNVRADRTSTFELSTDRPILIDYDVEIAQAASIQDPIVVLGTFGTRLSIQAAPSDQGMQLALFWKRGELLGEPRALELDIHSMISSEKEKEARWIEQASVVQDAEILSRSAAFSTLLPTGKAIAIRTSVDLKRGGTNEFVILRHTGGVLPQMVELPLSKGGSKVIVADMGSVAPPKVMASGMILWPGYVARNLDSEIYGSRLLSAEMRQGDEDFVSDMLDLGFMYINVDRFGRWMVARPFSDYIDEENESVVGEQDRLRAGLAALKPPAKLLDVQVTVRRPGKGGNPVTARLPVRAGTSISLALGVESMDMQDYDVEVAQFAAIADPKMHQSFDGLALYLKPTMTSRGDVLLDIRGGTALLAAQARLDLSANEMSFLEQPTHDHLLVNERLVVAKGGDGTWTATLGDASGKSDPDSLVIEIQISE